jgi:hypothetical protein
MQPFGECLPEKYTCSLCFMYNVFSTMYLIISKMYFCVHDCWLFVVHDWYQSFWLKHQTSMGRNEFEFEKFTVTDFKLCEFGEKWKY